MRRLGVGVAIFLFIVAAASAASPVYFGGALGGAHIRPASVSLSADGTLEASQVHWSSWGGSVATGDGLIEYHGCVPNCAQAPSHTVAGSVRLSHIRVCAGRRWYSQASVYVRRQGGMALLQRSTANWAPCQ
jgi:hypothetical protein